MSNTNFSIDSISLYLKRIAASGDVPHALLFYGSDEAQRKIRAIEFIKTFHCASPSKELRPCNACCQCAILEKEEKGAAIDTLFLAPDEENGEITIDKIRSLRKFMMRSSFDGGWKTVLIQKSDRLNREAAAALLKILEEPRGKTCMILLAGRFFLLPATIRSRLVPVRFFSNKIDQIPPAVYENIFAAIREMIQSPFLKKMMIAQDLAQKTSPLLFCDALILFLEEILVFGYNVLRNQSGSSLRFLKSASGDLRPEKLVALLKETHALRQVQERGMYPHERIFVLIASKL